MQIECYAQRLLNPFRGVMHIIRYLSAEAVTTDGVEWDIYVANDALLNGLGAAARRTQISDIRYGHWSAEKGLKRGPLFPSEDFKRLEERGAVVFEYLTQVHRDVPFTFRDQFELWLLDTHGQPLALLHSVLSDAETDTRPPLDWRAGMAAQKHFQSSALVHPSESSGAYLTRFVNSLAGGGVQWFRRSDEGAGLGLKMLNGDRKLEGRLLEAEAFPPLFIATAGMDAAHNMLVNDYHAWQAPWLLLLAHIDPDTRRIYETCAYRQAELLESQHRLYPAVIDRIGLQAARVEAALIRSQPRASVSEDSAAASYIELSVSADE